MPTERTYKTEGLIIKKTKLGEADRILTIFTPKMGKIQGFAKSVRKTTSKLSGHLELLSYSNITLTKGRGLDTIIGSQNIDAFLDIKDDLNRISYALYIAELVDLFTKEANDDEALFYHTINCLQYLGKTAYPKYLLRYFESQLLIYTGYAPELHQCVKCQKDLINTRIGGFYTSGGGIVCYECMNNFHLFTYQFSNTTYKNLIILQNATWDEIKDTPPDPDTLYTIEMVFRRYIHFILEKDVKSISWLDYLEQISPNISY